MDVEDVLLCAHRLVAHDRNLLEQSVNEADIRVSVVTCIHDCLVSVHPNILINEAHTHVIENPSSVVVLGIAYVLVDVAAIRFRHAVLKMLQMGQVRFVLQKHQFIFFYGIPREAPMICFAEKSTRDVLTGEGTNLSKDEKE